MIFLSLIAFTEFCVIAILLHLQAKQAESFHRRQRIREEAIWRIARAVMAERDRLRLRVFEQTLQLPPVTRRNEA